MRSFFLVLSLALSLPVSAQAASYETTFGSIVDPILATASYGGGIHPYSGPNLEPFASLSDADLTGASLPDAFLLGADLNDASLRDADLSLASLSAALLAGADLTGASLTGAALLGAALQGATMLEADLSGADLFFANLTGAVLGEADLTSTDLTDTNLTGVDLSGATYDEFTLFPSGNAYDNPPWGLDGGISPWDAGMIPVPEPSVGMLLMPGVGALAGLAVMRRGNEGRKRIPSRLLSVSLPRSARVRVDARRSLRAGGPR